MRLARMFGTRLETFKKVMESLKGIPREYGDAAYEFQFLEGLKLCFVLWAGDEEFPPSGQILDSFFRIISRLLMRRKTPHISEMWVLDYMKRFFFLCSR